MLIYLALTLLGIIVTCTALLVAVKLFYRPKYPNHPPFVGPDMWTNVALLTDSTSCSAVTHLLELHKSLNNFGKTTRGAVFQIYMMSKNFTIVSDYNLARLIFAGDISKGVKESEKTSMGRAFDMFPKYGSIFSSLTSDQQRHKTRKFLAPCFSMSNLKYTFEVILNSLVTCQQKLSAYAKDGTEFDLNDVMITLTFDVITESSFGVNWNTQKDDIVSDGTVFLHESEVRLREGFRRTLNPLRKITFWTNDYQRRELAVQRLSTILRKVLSDYRSRTNDIEADHSIMGHLMNNAYENDDARITDMSTFLTAGTQLVNMCPISMYTLLCIHHAMYPLFFYFFSLQAMKLLLIL
jgi:cytochrome P450